MAERPDLRGKYDRLVNSCGCHARHTDEACSPTNRQQSGLAVGLAGATWGHLSTHSPVVPMILCILLSGISSGVQL